MIKGYRCKLINPNPSSSPSSSLHLPAAAATLLSLSPSPLLMRCPPAVFFDTFVLGHALAVMGFFIFSYRDSSDNKNENFSD